MFLRAEPGLIDGADIRARQIKAIVKAHLIPENPGLIPKKLYESLALKWACFTGPVRDPDHFAICVEAPGAYEDEQQRYAYAEYDHGRMILDFRLDVEINQDLLCTQVPFAVTPIAGTAVTGGNKKCPCGSGRKYKKCCGS